MPANTDRATSEVDGWEPIDGVEQAQSAVIDDLDLLPDLTHPVRGMLLRRLREPRSVAELAELMDVPVTRLYHHVNRLESLGLIQVVATRKVAAVTERRYQGSARSYRLGDGVIEAADPRELAQALGALFDTAKLSLQRQVEAGQLPDPGRHVLSLLDVRLTPERFAALVERITAIVEELAGGAGDDDPGAEDVTVFLTAFPDPD